MIEPYELLRIAGWSVIGVTLLCVVAVLLATANSMRNRFKDHVTLPRKVKVFFRTYPKYTYYYIDWKAFAKGVPIVVAIGTVVLVCLAIFVVGLHTIFIA